MYNLNIKSKLSIQILLVIISTIFSLNSYCIEINKPDSISSIKLPTLSYLIEVAYENSPLIKSQTNVIEQKKIELKIEKKSWLNFISVNSNYSRGTNNAQINGTTVIQTNTSTVSNWYNTGVSLNLPFAAIISRKQNASIRKLNQSIEEDNLEILKQKIKLLIADLYSNIELKMRILELRSDASLQSNINYKYAEIEFKNNTITIAEFSKVYEEYIKAKIQFEEAKKDYWYAIKLLEENVGKKIK
jgi:outer membrane protein TolC